MWHTLKKKRKEKLVIKSSHVARIVKVSFLSHKWSDKWSDKWILSCLSIEVGPKDSASPLQVLEDRSVIFLVLYTPVWSQ